MPHALSTHTPTRLLVPSAVHPAQAAPPLPQFSGSFPFAHDDTAQQPYPQAGSQPAAVAWHAPETHDSPSGQARQAWPSRPHAPSLSPGLHVVPPQQPLVHEGPQPEGMHVPAEQTIEGPQTSHWAPPEPHASSVVPASQLVPEQQPLEQFPALHPVEIATHSPLSAQVWLVEQWRQVAPFLPQKSSLLPAGSQVSAVQQPAQVAAQLAGATHWPERQTFPDAAQSWHTTLPVPQAALASPVAQPPVPSQQPVQVWPTQVPPLPVLRHEPPVQCSSAAHGWQVEPPAPHIASVVGVTHVVPLQQPAQLAAPSQVPDPPPGSATSFSTEPRSGTITSTTPEVCSVCPFCSAPTTIVRLPADTPFRPRRKSVGCEMPGIDERKCCAPPSTFTSIWFVPAGAFFTTSQTRTGSSPSVKRSHAAAPSASRHGRAARPRITAIHPE
jgi:hypothetical protein